MKQPGRWWVWLGWLLVWAWAPEPACAQDLVITNGVHTYPVLVNTTATLEGRSELHLTDPTTPLDRSRVYLNSDNAWLVFDGVRPSEVVSSYLRFIRVNDMPATVDSNVRVVAYAGGAVIIPQPAGFQPLEVFAGPHFSGASQRLTPYTAYTGSSLGPMNNAIRSFILKRGYLATLAQGDAGTGLSTCYVAQDGDLEVSLLPSGLDSQVSFIRIFPWRWTSKKGIAGNIWQNLDLGWYYNWNIDQNSSRDVEYVAIRQTRWWPGLSQDWQARGINHLLGFNEPDSPDQADMSVGDAIWSWPDLLGTGLRVGAPAVTDGGRNWLYAFMDEADAAGLRVDFVPVHYYWCFNPSNPSGAANQFYNFLKDVHDRVQRPLWITEWNNGANWTGCGDPSFAQQEAAISAMIDMLDSTPFVERYALYNWVEDVRRVKWDDGSLTSAGVTYRDQQSPMAHIQQIPRTGSPGIAQFSFDDHLRDRSGHGNNAFAFGMPAHAPGTMGQAIELDGAAQFLQLPPNLGDSTDFTFAAWIYWDGGGRWQRIFDFANDTSEYMFLSPSVSGDLVRFTITTSGWGGEQRLEASTALPTGRWQHVAVTLSGNVGRLYLNGRQVDVGTITIDPADFHPAVNYLGRSQFPADPNFNGRLDEVVILDQALSASRIAALMANQPPRFSGSPITGENARAGQAYTASLVDEVTDPDPLQPLAFAKTDGPDWLTIEPDGGMTGTPGVGDLGENLFTVIVTDAAQASDFAILAIQVDVTEIDGLLNGSFELPPTSGTVYAPADGFWTFSGSDAMGRGSGVTANNSAFTSGNLPAPDGVQVGFLHSNSLISQTFTGFIPGAEYAIRFQASQRQNTPGGQLGQTAVVRMDSTTLGGVEPAQALAGYTDYVFPMVASATNHTFTIVGTNRNGGDDNTLFIDNVRAFVTTVPTPQVEIRRNAGGAVEVAWPPGQTGWHLDMEDGLPGTGWVDLPGAAGTNQLEVPTATDRAVFRLRAP